MSGVTLGTINGVRGTLRLVQPHFRS